MNPNLLPNNSQEALGVRKPKNELVSGEAQKRLREVTPGIINGRDALVKNITQAEAAFLQEQGRVAMQYTVANMPTRQYEFHGQVAPQTRPGTIQSGQELQRRFIPQEVAQPQEAAPTPPPAPATPPPLDLQARIAQLQREAAEEAQGKQDIVNQLGKAA